MCAEREMTLLEFCNTLPKNHMVNKELQVIKDTIESFLQYVEDNSEWDVPSNSLLGLQMTEMLNIFSEEAP